MNNKKIRPKISIIIPVYNVERYIRKCLESVVNQTLKEIEIIIVDDVSPDNSIKIAQEFQKNDSRIKIITHKKNKGTFLARSSGTIEASGKYIQYLDPDDWLERNACEKIYQIFENNDCDLCQIGMNLHDEEQTSTNQITETSWGIDEKKMTGLDLLKLALEQRIIHSTWSIVVKRGIALKTCIDISDDDKLVFEEDLLYFFIASFYSNKCIYLDESVYNYRSGVGITSDVKQNAEKFVISIINRKKIFNIMRALSLKFEIESEIIKYIKIKETSSKINRLNDWNNLNDKNKQKVFKLLYEQKCLEEWVGILYEFDKLDKINSIFQDDYNKLIQKKVLSQKNRELNLKNSKSFRLGDLFFRSIKKPYKLLTFPINFLVIIFDLNKELKKKIVNFIVKTKKKFFPAKWT